jgi:uncharacterized protein DUF2784
MSALLADVILLAHFALASFITAGFVLVLVGAVLDWRWVRRRALRLVHLYGMLFIAAESLAGIACPLTLLEDLLRGAPAGAGGFIQRWLGRLLYWNAPAWFFVTLYVGAAALALLLWWAVPPRRSGRSTDP